MIPKILTIAGSDPSGGAGIQADLKTFSALGCYGMSVMTALTAQNTQGVRAVLDLPADFVKAQLEAIFEDIAVDAVKIGMVGSPLAIEVVAEVLAKQEGLPVVLDPVMVAGSGDRLTSDESVAALKEKLMPLAAVVTPNIPEAEVLLGYKFSGDLEDTARALHEMSGGAAILLKGGHMDTRYAVDVLIRTGGGIAYAEEPRIDTNNTHGTGCTLSSALACFLARGHRLPEAFLEAKRYLTDALAHADELELGKGKGPVHHFHALWADQGKKAR